MRYNIRVIKKFKIITYLLEEHLIVKKEYYTVYVIVFHKTVEKGCSLGTYKWILEYQIKLCISGILNYVTPIIIKHDIWIIIHHAFFHSVLLFYDSQGKEWLFLY